MSLPTIDTPRYQIKANYTTSGVKNSFDLPNDMNEEQARGIFAAYVKAIQGLSFETNIDNVWLYHWPSDATIATEKIAKEA